MAEASWPEGVLDIPIQEDLAVDTHSTGGEHLTKEIDSWQLFNRLLEAAELSLPGDVEDPIQYYMSHGPGRFHRAYRVGSREMFAAMTTRPDNNGGRQIDTLVTVADPSLTATAVQEIFTRNIFSEFAGMKPLPHTKRVTMPGAMATQNLGVMRALYDVAVPRGEDFTIPMPNIVTPPLELDAVELEKAKAARPNDFTGVLRYIMPDTADTTSVEEFFREGEFIGKVVSVSPEGSLRAPDVSATDANNQPIELQGSTLHTPKREIRFLKTLAEGNLEMAELILAG